MERALTSAKDWEPQGIQAFLKYVAWSPLQRYIFFTIFDFVTRQIGTFQTQKHNKLSFVFL